MATIIILALFGIVLIGLEIFLPGGILGLVGIGCSVAAVVLCFTTEAITESGMWLSFVMAACVVGLTAVLLYFWLKYFQRTHVGKRFVLESKVGGSKNGKSALVGEEGEAANDLRPLGKVVIGGKKLDARSESGLITRGSRVRVVNADGMELVVRDLGVAEKAPEDSVAKG